MNCCGTACPRARRWHVVAQGGVGGVPNVRLWMSRSPTRARRPGRELGVTTLAPRQPRASSAPLQLHKRRRASRRAAKTVGYKGSSSYRSISPRTFS